MPSFALKGFDRQDSHLSSRTVAWSKSLTPWAPQSSTLQSDSSGLALSYAHRPHFLACSLQRLKRGVALPQTCTASSPLHLHAC